MCLYAQKEVSVILLQIPKRIEKESGSTMYILRFKNKQAKLWAFTIETLLKVMFWGLKQKAAFLSLKITLIVHLSVKLNSQPVSHHFFI